MSVVCPSCQHPINAKASRPGRYRVKCANCGQALQLACAIDGTLSATAPAADANVTAPDAPEPKLAPSAMPDADRTAAQDTEDPAAHAPREVTVQFNQSGGAAVERPVAADHVAADALSPIEPTAVVPDIQPSAKTRPDRDVTAAGTDAEQAAESDERPPKMPVVVGNHEIVKCLGKGGMGAVYLARQRSLDRMVALKVIHPRWAQDPRFLVRFTREAYAAAQLVHHNVVQVYDIGADRGINWFSMEYVDGSSLGTLLAQQGRLDPRIAAGYILQAARALQFAHERGMVHRDVKPDNLMLNNLGIVKLADLGLVRTPGATEVAPAAGTVGRSRASSKKSTPVGTLASMSGVTLVTQTMGTPSYMAPEQTRSAINVDERADIYSLGCTFYTLITGRTVFKARNAQEMMLKQQNEPVVPPQTYVKNLPKPLADIIVKMLAKNPAARFQTSAAVVRALEKFLGIGHDARTRLAEEKAETLAQGVRAFRAVPAARRRPLILTGGVAVCLLAMLISLFAGAWITAGSLLGLALLTPLAYLIVGGSQSHSYLFQQERQYVLGGGWLDWVKAGAGMLLFVIILYFTGLLLVWTLVCVVAAGLAFALYYLLDRPIARQRQGALSEVEKMLKGLRLRGISEEAIQKFVCQYAGDQWEEVFEELFGYEAKLAARAKWGAGPKGPRPRFAAWRDPIVHWIQARERARHEARDRIYLQAIEQQNLVAEGMQAAEARQQAERVAEAMVEKAAQIKEAEHVDDALVHEVVPHQPESIPQMKAPPEAVLVVASEGTEDGLDAVDSVEPAPRRARVDVREMVTLADQPLPDRPRRRLLPRLASLMIGGGGRFMTGAVLLCAGLGGLHASKLADDFQTLSLLDPESWQTFWTALIQPCRILSLPLLPELWLKPVTCLAAALAGMLLLITSVQSLRWRSPLHYACAVVMVMGPVLGVPPLGPIDAAVVSLAAGGGLSIFVIVYPWLRRRRAAGAVQGLST
jgi:hypothetical protein